MLTNFAFNEPPKLYAGYNERNISIANFVALASGGSFSTGMSSDVSMTFFNRFVSDVAVNKRRC